MSRPSKPPRLFLHKRKGKATRWLILHDGKQIVTGAIEGERRKAEAALANYIVLNHKPDFGDGHPTRVLISDVLNEYLEKHAPDCKRSDLIAIGAELLGEFFDGKAVSDINPESCNAYVKWRVKQFRPAKPYIRNGKQITPRQVKKIAIKPATARRELVVLGAALTWCWRNGKLDRLIPVKLPDQAQPRDRYLTRTEAAMLIAGALGFYRDDNGKWKRNKFKINRHVARFILIGIYTGTRHDAIVKLHWHRNSEGGWIDLEGGVIYRRPDGDIETIKKRTPAPIPERLLPHLRRWKKITSNRPIEYGGKPVRKQRRAFETSRDLAGLGSDVVPHSLKHTCCTWLLQGGVSTYDVSHFVGTSEAVIRRTYGHHATDGIRRSISVGFSRPNRVSLSVSLSRFSAPSISL
jgi:integrase